MSYSLTASGQAPDADTERKLHEELALSGYHSPLYDGLYAGWHRTELAAFTGNSTARRRRVEVLWSNRRFPALQEVLSDIGAAVPP